MGAVIGDLLFLGLSITIGPVPPVAAILLLSGQRGQAKGIAYLIGWVIGLTLLMAGVVFFVRRYDYSSDGVPSLLMAWAMLLGGLALLLLAYVTWQRRPPPDAMPPLPQWLKTIDKVTPLMALAAGFFFGLVSLKNLVFATAAAAAIGKAHLSILQSYLSILLFILIATTGIAAPVYVSYVKKEKAQTLLDGWVRWLSANNTTIVCLLCMLVGVRLIGDGLGQLL
jgi:hypothetical protein